MGPGNHYVMMYSGALCFNFAAVSTLETALYPHVMTTMNSLNAKVAIRGNRDQKPPKYH